MKNLSEQLVPWTEAKSIIVQWSTPFDIKKFHSASHQYSVPVWLFWLTFGTSTIRRVNSHSHVQLYCIVSGNVMEVVVINWSPVFAEWPFPFAVFHLSYKHYYKCIKIFHFKSKYLFILRCYKHGSHTYQPQRLAHDHTNFLKHPNETATYRIFMESKWHCTKSTFVSVNSHFNMILPIWPLDEISI